MRTTRNRSRHLYRDLSPAERFRLAITALGRGDFAEYRHLVATAPHSTIEVLHVEMREPWEELRSITWRFRSGVAAPIGQLKILECAADALREVWGGNPSNAPLIEVIAEMLEQARAIPAKQLRTWVEAYLEITTMRFGLSRETMLAIQHPEISGPLDRFRDLLEATQPEEADAEAVRAELMDSMAPADLSDLEEAS